MKGVEHGQRKVRHAREQALLMLCGFLTAAWMKAPTELFVAYVVGLTGLSGAFVWGNAQEHRADAPVQGPKVAAP